MLHLLSQLLCSCDSFFHEFWPSVNVACQWNAHSLSPLYIVMGWPCAVRTSEEVWHCAVMCCLLQCSLSMSEHFPFLIQITFILKYLSTATWNYAHICASVYTNTQKKWQNIECDRPWWAKHKWSFLPGGQFQFSYSVRFNLKKSLFFCFLSFFYFL